MQQARNTYLVCSGLAAAAGALIHIAAIFGGPAWYRFIGATEPIIKLVERGHTFPVVIVLVAATVLFACALYAFSGAGLIPRLPLLRTGLVVITIALLVHGVAFIPAVILWPKAMLGAYDGDGINTILVVTNFLCFVVGMAYLLGTRVAWANLSVRQLKHGTA